MVVTPARCLLMLTGLMLFIAVGSNALGQRPDGQRPDGQRPDGQRPDGQRPRGQRPGEQGRGGPGFRGPGGFGGGGPLELLQRPDVQAELEMLDDQKQEARALAEKSAARRREVLGQFAGQARSEELSEEERQARRQRMQKAFQGLNDEMEEALSFLLPHQRKRLSQLEIQWRMRGGGGFGALASREVGEQLQISDQQRNELRTKGQELGQELQKKIAELQREYQQKLLAELDPDQRAKFQEMVGDPFEFRGPGPGRPGGGRPGGGRPGGERPGGARPERPPSN